MAAAVFYLNDPAAPKPNRPAHLGVNILLEWDGKLLLERRRDCGMWGLPGGGVKGREPERRAMVRELWEETGIRVQPQELTLLGTECVPRVFLDIYAVKKPVPLSQLVFQPGETDAAQWMDFSQWRGLAGKGAYLTPSWREREEDALFSRMEAFSRDERDTSAQQG